MTTYGGKSLADCALVHLSSWDTHDTACNSGISKFIAFTHGKMGPCAKPIKAVATAPATTGLTNQTIKPIPRLLSVRPRGASPEDQESVHEVLYVSREGGRRTFSVLQ
jgi:hypothetical protein